MTYLMQLLIAVDQLGNALLAGWADETISSRAWRLRETYRFWAVARVLIDGVFFLQENHCQEAFESERKRVQEPPELRQ